MRAALAAGQRVFGENRVQEALAKFPQLRGEFPDLELHLIGPLQTNKVKDAVAHCDVIETRRSPAPRRGAGARDRADRPPRVLLHRGQYRRGGAEGRHLRRAPPTISSRDCRDRLGLPIAGLMCIPPEHEEPALHFALLREIAKRNGLAALSMGMSADFETAIRFGATHVRVGTAIFGARRAAVANDDMAAG